jgi:hypothetical protein
LIFVSNQRLSLLLRSSKTLVSGLQKALAESGIIPSKLSGTNSCADSSDGRSFCFYPERYGTCTKPYIFPSFPHEPSLLPLLRTGPFLLPFLLNITCLEVQVYFSAGSDQLESSIRVWFFTRNNRTGFKFDS